mgnify:CR=1 FL=1|jgi:hypothetical protein
MGMNTGRLARLVEETLSEAKKVKVGGVVMHPFEDYGSYYGVVDGELVSVPMDRNNKPAEDEVSGVGFHTSDEEKKELEKFFKKKFGLEVE